MEQRREVRMRIGKGIPYADSEGKSVCGQQRSRSACADAQADQDLCCPLTA